MGFQIQTVQTVPNVNMFESIKTKPKKLYQKTANFHPRGIENSLKMGLHQHYVAVQVPEKRTRAFIIHFFSQKTETT